MTASPSSGRRLLRLALACACALAGACGGEPGPAAPAPAPPGAGARAYDLEGRPLRVLPAIPGWNVVVIAHEQPPAEAPEALPAGFARTEAVCASPWPWSSAASLLTGLVPSQHAVKEDGVATPALARAWTTTAEVLQNAYRYQTAAFASRPWPAASVPLLQGFAVTPTTGPALAQLEAWLATRDATRPFFVYVQLGAEEAQAEPLLTRLASASASRPLLAAVTHLRGRDLPATAPSEQVYADSALLVPLAWRAPPEAPLPPAGVALRGLLGYVLARLGAPEAGDAHAARWDAGARAVAHFEWIGAEPGGGSGLRLVHGARDASHTYAVVYDMRAGTVLEHLLERSPTGPTRDRAGEDGRLPPLDLDPALCRAIEEVRDLVWGRVGDMNWRIESGYVSDLKAVPLERPAPACAR